jgi:type IV pilus assembly protein PilQ
MKKWIAGIGVICIVSCAFRSLWCLDPFVTLDQIAHDDTAITMTLSGETKCHVFKISNPPRLVVEFANTEYNYSVKEIAVAHPVIKRIRGGQFQNTPVKAARVVVDLETMVPYQLKVVGKQVRLELTAATGITAAAGESVPAATPALEKTDTAAAVKPLAAASATPVPAAKPARDEDATITIAAPVQQDNKKDKKNAPAAEDPEYTATAAQHAASPAASFSPVTTDEKPAAVTTPAAAAITAKPAPKNDTKSITLSRKPITFDFEEADVRDILRILSMKSGINIIYGSDVSGTLTLHLENVPFDQAFETILSLKGLVSQEQGTNIIRVVTPQKISEERSQAVTFTKVFPLNYAKAEEIKQNLDSIRSAEGRKGSISVDARTNSLIVTDTPEGLSSVERIIAELDKKPSQVIIEAKIVEVVLSKSLDLGIQWQYANTLVNDPNTKVYVGATKAETSNSALGSGAASGSAVVSPLATTDGGSGVTFPATSVSGQMSSIAFGIISNQARLTGLLTALSQKGLSKLLSTPRVTTINNKDAKILVGQRIPYTTTTVTATGSTQQTNFLDVGVKLSVTPTINVDQKITLQVHPEVSLFIRADAAGPVIGTREAQTTVIVNNGETVVIGGLITDEDKKMGAGVPLLADLPVIGHLFKRDYKTKDRTELLVFITPQIIN